MKINKMKRITFICFTLILFLVQNTHAQYASTKIKDKHQIYTDSLKQVKYDNIFPIWGQKAYEKGFDIPYPTGIMVNYFYVKQSIIVENLRLGLQTDNQDIPLTEVDFIKFGNNFSTANTVMFRPDVWVFPFLNVYGIFGYGNSTTEVNVTAPIELKSVVDQSVRTSGFGLTAAGGIGPVWIAVDGNITWTKPELLDKPVKVNTFGVRFGHNFENKNKPYRNLGIWVGAMKASISSNTVGQIKLKDALPQTVFDRADEIVDDYYTWYNSLDPNNIIDSKKIEVADQVLTPIIERIESADGETIIRYGIDKRVKQEWNGLIGAQFQWNKNWTLRTEAGIIGDRKSFLLSLNYRFLL
jgi:opacity protein-like surface antigen